MIMTQLIDLSSENSENNDEEVLDLTDDADDETSEKTGVRAVIPASMRWKKGLAVGNNGKPLGCTSNLVRIFRAHPEAADLLGYDSRSGRIVLLRKPPWVHDAVSYPDALRDEDCINALCWLAGLKPRIIAASSQVGDALFAVACQNKFDPFLRHLESLLWDGRPRLDNFLVELCGAENVPLNRVFFRKWLCSAVARAFQPGVQVDSMLVLVGAQGVGKDRIYRALAPEPRYLLEGLPRSSNKDSLISLQGPVFCHDSELDYASRRSVEELKEFLSRTSDAYRPPYGKSTTQHPRRVVFCGSTNDETPFKDSTGNRRFWPVRVTGRVNIDGIIEQRDQLWSEAVHLYRAREPWWLTDSEESLAFVTQSASRACDPVEERLAVALVGQSVVTIGTAFAASNLPDEPRNHARVRFALVAIGYRRVGKRRISGCPNPVAVYERVEP